VVTELRYRQRRLAVRTLDERLAIRFPRLIGLIAALATRLPPRSGVRRHLVARRTCQGFQAVNRGDLDVLLTIYHDDVITSLGAIEGWPADLIGDHHGKPGFKRLFETWNSTWDDLHVEPREVIDTGERLMVTVDMTGRGKTSGVPTTVRYWDLYTLRDGLISRHEMFRERESALAAAGIPGRSQSAF
jgi:ketosteroid isomerase-like protein